MNCCPLVRAAHFRARCGKCWTHLPTAKKKSTPPNDETDFTHGLQDEMESNLFPMKPHRKSVLACLSSICLSLPVLPASLSLSVSHSLAHSLTPPSSFHVLENQHLGDPKLGDTHFFLNSSPSSSGAHKVVHLFLWTGGLATYVRTRWGRPLMDMGFVTKQSIIQIFLFPRVCWVTKPKRRRSLSKRRSRIGASSN